MKKLLVLLALIFCLTACNPQVVGTVIDKDHERGYWDHYTHSESYRCGTEYYTTGTGKNRRSATRTKYCYRSVPDQRWISERWNLRVRDKEGRIHTVKVSKSEYMRTSKGSHFDNTR